MTTRLLDLLIALHLAPHKSDQSEVATMELLNLKRGHLTSEQGVKLDALVAHINAARDGKDTSIEPKPEGTGSDAWEATGHHDTPKSPEHAAAEYEAGKNIAKRGHVLPDEATEDVKRGYADYLAEVKEAGIVKLEEAEPVEPPVTPPEEIPAENS